MSIRSADKSSPTVLGMPRVSCSGGSTLVWHASLVTLHTMVRAEDIVVHTEDLSGTRTAVLIQKSCRIPPLGKGIETLGSKGSHISLAHN